MTPLLRKLNWLVRRGQKEAELRDELQFHLDEEAAARHENGLSIDQAQDAARRDLGNLMIVREETRAAWTWTLFEQLRQDLRYGVRMITANKVFSAMAILSLALGIGANAAIFSFMDAILMRSLPVSDPQTLVTLAWHTNGHEFAGSNRHDDDYDDPNGGYVGGVFAYQAFELFQRETSVFAAVFGFQGAGDLHIAANGEATIANGEYVTGTYFSGLGAVPAAGRLITPDDDQAGAPAVAVLSYTLSEARFGGAERAPGQSILIDNIPFTVIGVTPPEFFGADSNVVPGLYVPLHTNVLLQASDKFARAVERYGDPNFDWIVPMARLRPGVSAAQAQAAVGPAFSAWKVATDTRRPNTDLPTLIVRPSAEGLDGLRRTYSKPLFLLLGLVGLILAIACADIANLLLARASARTREMAVRLSMGAGRERVIRQLITESLLLSGIGGVLGVAFAIWGIRFLLLLLLNGRGDVPFALEIGVNWRVLSAVAALAVLTGVLFGLAPALKSTRLDLTSALKTVRARGTLTHPERRISLSRVLVIVQVALTLLILVATGLFLRTLSNLQSIELGFNREQLLTFQINPRQAGHTDPEIMTFYDRLSSEFAALPGVQSVTLSDSPLLGLGYSGTNVTIAGGPTKNSHVLSIGPAFFSTLQIPLRRGREIDGRDRPGSPYAAVVNEEFARIAFGQEDPIGRRLQLKRACPTCDMEIVGVVANTLYGQLRKSPSTAAAPPPTVFLAFAQAAWGPVAEATYQLRTAGNPLGAVRAVREIVQRADRRVPVARVKTQRALIEGTFNQEMAFARLCTAFAVLALAIACIGLYGTMAYGVARRTSEIGIRMALGARRATVVWMVLREALRLAAIGLLVSIPVALTASKVVEPFLFGLQRNDPLALAAAVVTIVAALLVAAYLLARDASRIEPIVALQHE